MMYKLLRIATVDNLLQNYDKERPPLVCGECMEHNGLFYYLKCQQYESIFAKFLMEYRCDICDRRSPNYIINDYE